ncbi:hypothetical protein HanRHA438_Chr04g0177811 [Helianthus annuus]|nr:hypothetical protein HanRHA438_Chr04g0177811 [Helianthus annuus]
MSRCGQNVRYARKCKLTPFLTLLAPVRSYKHVFAHRTYQSLFLRYGYIKLMFLFRSVCRVKLITFTHQFAYNFPESDIEFKIDQK